jgi:ABC-type uncharacterized transport system ATPase subunit
MTTRGNGVRWRLFKGMSVLENVEVILAPLGHARKLILLDEPATGMSEAECEELMLLVKAIPSTSACGVLLIEHNMRVMMGVSSRTHVLDGGRTLAEGAPAEIQRNQAVVDAYLGIEGQWTALLHVENLHIR